MSYLLSKLAKKWLHFTHSKSKNCNMFAPQCRIQLIKFRSSKIISIRLSHNTFGIAAYSDTTPFNIFSISITQSPLLEAN